MPRVRRHDLAPRVELLPLLDVIFLLLTFFIYAMTVMVQARVLPVRLTPVAGGHRAAPRDVAALTIDRAGGLYLDRRPITAGALDAKLKAMAHQPDPPTLYLAMAADQPKPGRGGGDTSKAAAAGDAAGAGGGSVDRGPMLIRLIQQVQSAGLHDFQLVGSPTSASGSNTSGSSASGSNPSGGVSPGRRPPAAGSP